MKEKSEGYRWSSAASHCGLKRGSLLADLPDSMRIISKDDWPDWLAIEEMESVVDVIQRNVEKGLPRSGDSFIGMLEKVAGRSLRYKLQGRPLKNIKG